MISRTPALDPSKPWQFFAEDECGAAVNTLFLTNRECPWRCVMCDLWKNTLTESVGPGTIPRQIEYALQRLPPARQIKLYNSGSFFDAQAIPREDYGAIAELIRPFERVVVECHPALVGQGCFDFQARLAQPLEVAMGLETANPEVLEKLNKRMTVEQFAQAADMLRAREIALRVFLLVQPPFSMPEDALVWTQRSLEIAFNCGATATSLIPTRSGNGAMEALAMAGAFTAPLLAMVESAVEYGLRLRRGRVFADLWDLRQSRPQCTECWPSRIQRLQEMNLTQCVKDAVDCTQCGGRS